MALSAALIIKYGLIALGIIVAGFLIVQGIRRTVNVAEISAIRAILKLVSDKGLDYENEPDHPRLVSNMNKIYLPKIEADFPEFDWNETKRMIEAEIKKRFEDKKGLEIDETVISRYEKSGNHRIIRTESAASYLGEDDSKKYTVFLTELSFINTKKLDKDGNEEPRALTCPRCGAPLVRAANGDVVCEFCETIVVGEKVWQITEIKEK